MYTRVARSSIFTMYEATINLASLPKPAIASLRGKKRDFLAISLIVSAYTFLLNFRPKVFGWCVIQFKFSIQEDPGDNIISTWHSFKDRAMRETLTIRQQCTTLKYKR